MKTRLLTSLRRTAAAPLVKRLLPVSSLEIRPRARVARRGPSDQGPAGSMPPWGAELVVLVLPDGAACERPLGDRAVRLRAVVALRAADNRIMLREKTI